MLYTDIGWLIRQAKNLTDIPVAVITNGSLLYDPQVRNELSAADAVLPALDAAPSHFPPEAQSTATGPDQKRGEKSVGLKSN